ncbi:MAG: helix-turn-helix domain-containing protein [Candidatus Binatia bacterium]
MLVERLRATTKEGRHFEWKQHPPIGPTVSTRAKYRMVKTAISFANWEGGFVLFGVEPNGNWRGLQQAELSSVDPASLSELINGCIFPEIPHLNYIDFNHESKLFALLHVPPSATAPHVTTKELVERDSAGKLHVVLQKHALYCRQGAKSDLATPQRHHQILTRRMEGLRDELLRRVKEVHVGLPTIATQGQLTSTATTLTVTRLTTDPNALAVRLTRRKEGTSGILLHEELSGGLFDEINNVVDANALLAGGRELFVLGEPIYYRIYAERQHVESEEIRVSVLARTGLRDYYAPNLFWLLRLPPEIAADVIRRAAEELKAPQVNGLIRLAVLLGQDASDWLWSRFEKQWGTHSQAPDYFWSFKEMRKRKITEPRLAALRITGRALVDVPGGPPLPADALLAKPLEAASLLSRACVKVFGGEKEYRQSARYLDVLAYGAEIAAAGPGIIEALRG